ncbi:MAG: hypothetical protein WAP36_10055, partial [Halanaerobiales bacterium]
TWYNSGAPLFDPREIATAELAARQYADQKAAEDIDATQRTIYAPGVIIDSTGAWGIANGIKQAGFGTDGKLVAGGGSVVADADGLEIKDTNATRVFLGNIGGKRWGNGELPPNTYGLWGDRAGVYLRGYPRVISWGYVDWGNSPTRVINGATVEVPSGTKWLAIVNLVDGAVIEELGWKNKDWQLNFYYRVFASFYQGQRVLGPILNAGTHNNISLDIYHSIELNAWDGSTNHREIRQPSALWQIIEIEDM